MLWPAHDTARLTEAFRRAVLRRFVRLDLFDEDQAVGMPAWPHSGFHVHTAVWAPENDRAFATRLARYCARNPVALERLTYDRTAKAVTSRSDKSEGPTVGTETADPLKFLARVRHHRCLNNKPATVIRWPFALQIKHLHRKRATGFEPATLSLGNCPVSAHERQQAVI